MDAPGGPIEQQVDKALRDLFQEVGSHRAPDGLEQHVLQALSTPVLSAVHAERPLISRTTWATIIVFAMGISVGVLVAPGSGTNAGKLTSWLVEQIRVGDLLNAGNLPWILGVMAAAACLLGLDAYLTSRKAAFSARRR